MDWVRDRFDRRDPCRTLDKSLNPIRAVSSLLPIGVVKQALALRTRSVSAMAILHQLAECPSFLLAAFGYSVSERGRVSAVAKSADELVDVFVSFLNGVGFEPKFQDEIPEELRTSSAEYDTFHWQIKPLSSNPWVEELVQKLPQTWPKPFRSLIERYRFCNFEIGPLMLFANSGHELFYELSDRVFKDKGIFPTLHKNGFLQFGLPHETNYDPVCFDMKRRNRADAPIVQLDHEEILIRSRIRIVQQLAPSFLEFMQRAVAERLPVA